MCLGLRLTERPGAAPGVAILDTNIEVLAKPLDDEHYVVALLSPYPVDEQQQLRLSARLADVLHACGSTDPKVEQALRRQQPHQEAGGQYPGQAAKKPRLIKRLVGRG